MHGNVREWTSASLDSYRVGRGGGWDGSTIICESPERDESSSGGRFGFLGFRVVLDPAE